MHQAASLTQAPAALYKSGHVWQQDCHCLICMPPLQPIYLWLIWGLKSLISPIVPSQRYRKKHKVLKRLEPSNPPPDAGSTRVWHSQGSQSLFTATLISFYSQSCKRQKETGRRKEGLFHLAFIREQERPLLVPSLFLFSPSIILANSLGLSLPRCLSILSPLFYLILFATVPVEGHWF